MIASEDQARAELYDFLAGLIGEPPGEAALSALRGMKPDGETSVGAALRDLSAAAVGETARSARREYEALFIGLGRGELLPYASYYVTGNLHDKPLAALRRDMGRLGIARSEGTKDPEDNLASIMEMMAGLILGRYGDPAGIEAQAAFFEAHLAPWAGRFFTDLEAAKEAKLYVPVGTLGAAFMRIEAEAFRLA